MKRTGIVVFREIKRVIAEGDFVAVPVHHLDPAGGKCRATMDWFRLHAGGEIVEHGT